MRFHRRVGNLTSPRPSLSSSSSSLVVPCRIDACLPNTEATPQHPDHHHRSMIHSVGSPDKPGAGGDDEAGGGVRRNSEMQIQSTRKASTEDGSSQLSGKLMQAETEGQVGIP